MMASKNNNKKSQSIPKSNNKTRNKETGAKSPAGPTNRSQGFTIVGIGASAGDLKAHSALFEALAPNTSMAFTEELRSVNEELQTVNNDMKSKPEELSQAHQELENLMGASEIGTLFLNRELRVQHFTAGVNDIINSEKRTDGEIAIGELMSLRHRLNLMGRNLRVPSQPGKSTQVTIEIQPDRGHA